MSRTKKSDQLSELDRLCFKVKELISTQAYVDAAEEIQQAMLAFPHSPVPHNLLGILLEKKGDHYTAMRHFRAAWSLEPSYLPVKHNLDVFGDYNAKGTCAYHESDCPIENDD